MKQFSLNLLPEKADANLTSDGLLDHLSRQIESYNNEHSRLKDLELKYLEMMINRLSDYEPEKTAHVYDEYEESMGYHDGLIMAMVEFHSLSKSITTCRKAINSNDINKVALSFYLLGNQTNKIESGFYGDLKEEMINAYNSKKKQIKYLNEKKETERFFKFFAQSIAKSAWTNDSTIRITMMADHVLANFNRKGNEPFKGKKIRDFIPTIETIKKWIREIAPSQASKPGRDSKI